MAPVIGNLLRRNMAWISDKCHSNPNLRTIFLVILRRLRLAQDSGANFNILFANYDLELSNLAIFA